MARTSNPVHGVDFLIDHYSLLGVPRNATAEDIKGAYRKKQLQYHPDRYQNIAPEMLTQLERQSNLLNEAYEVLGDAEKRRSYDEELAKWTGPVSKHGEAIIDLTKPHFSFGSLLEQLNSDPEEREKAADEMALRFSMFNKATYEYFRKQAELPGGMPPELKPAYLEQLEQRELYLTLREQMLWDTLGQRNYAPTPRLEYREQVKEDVERVKAQALREVGQQVMLLASGERTLLPAPEGSSEKIDVAKALTLYTARIDEHFARQTVLLESLAAEHEKILEARFVVSGAMEYHPDTTTYTSKVLAQIGDLEKTVWVLITFNGEAVQVGNPPDGVEELDECGPESGAPKKWMELGYTILKLKPIQGVHFYDQVQRAADAHAEKLESVKVAETAA